MSRWNINNQMFSFGVAIYIDYDEKDTDNDKKLAVAIAKEFDVSTSETFSIAKKVIEEVEKDRKINS
jgi:hypothetical protein